MTSDRFDWRVNRNSKYFVCSYMLRKWLKLIFGTISDCGINITMWIVSSFFLVLQFVQNFPTSFSGLMLVSVILEKWLEYGNKFSLHSIRKSSWFLDNYFTILYCKVELNYQKLSQKQSILYWNLTKSWYHIISFEF